MQALVAIAIGALDTCNVPHMPPSQQSLDEAALNARARIMEEYDEWDQANEEGGDGGEAVKLVSSAQFRENTEFRRGIDKARKAEKKTLQQAYQRDHRPSHGGEYTNNTKTTGSQKGEIKYHDANKKLVQVLKSKDSRETRATVGSKGTGVLPHVRGLTMAESKTTFSNPIEASNNNAPHLSKRLAERLLVLDDDCEM